MSNPNIASNLRKSRSELNDSSRDNKNADNYVAYATFREEDHTPVGDVKYRQEEYLPDTGASAYIGAEEGGYGGDFSNDVPSDLPVDDSGWVEMDGGVGQLDSNNGADAAAENGNDDGNHGQEDSDVYSQKKETDMEHIIRASSHSVPTESRLNSERLASQRQEQGNNSNNSNNEEKNRYAMEWNHPKNRNEGNVGENDRHDNEISKTTFQSTQTEDVFDPSTSSPTTDIANVNTSSQSLPTSGTDTSSMTQIQYLEKYFPNGGNIYQKNENHEITGVTDNVSMVNRRDLKKAVCAHLYFLRHGFVKNDAKALELAGVLGDIKPSLSLVSQLKKRSDKWLNK